MNLITTSVTAKTILFLVFSTSLLSSSAFTASTGSVRIWGTTTSSSSRIHSSSWDQQNQDSYEQQQDGYSYEQQQQQYQQQGDDQQQQGGADPYSYGQGVDSTPSPAFSSDQQQPAEEEEPRLILGDEMGSKLEELKTKYPTSENAYLAAARERSMSAKEKYLAQMEAEERAAKERRAKKAAEAEEAKTDYGPGDLSEFQGFGDDGFEASEGNDQTGGWGDVAAAEEEEEEEGPGLFIPGADEGEMGLLL